MVIRYCGDNSVVSPSNIDHSCSDFASTIFQQVATNYQDDHSLDSNDDEASLDVDMFSKDGDIDCLLISKALLLSPSFRFSMDNILFWNGLGAGGRNFKYDISDLISMNKVSILIICELRVL